MNKFTLAFLVVLISAASGTYCNKGSSFPKDCDDRYKGRDCLLDGGDKSIDSSDRSDSGSHETPKPVPTSTLNPTTELTISTSTHGQCSCSCEGSGSGNSNESSGDNDDDASSGSGSFEEGSGSHEGSGSGGHGHFEYDDYCLLFQYFFNISIEITDIRIREAWIEFIEELQITIIYDKSLTYDEKLVAIWSKLEIFLEIHVEIRELVQYCYISEWGGYVFDLQSVVLFIQYQYSATIIEIDFSGSCILFEALRNCTGVDSEYYVQIEILIKEITVILESSYSYSYQLVLIYEKFQAFFVQYSEYKSIVFELEIEGYGSFASFYQVIVNYWRVYNYEIAVGGSTSECAIITVLTECYQNTSSGSASQRAQIKQLVEKLTVYYESNVEIEVRVEYFVAELYEFLIIQEWSLELIFSLEIEGYGSIYELIVAFGWEKQCGCVDFEQPTTPALETTTEAAETTTAAVETTTHKLGDCSTKFDVIKFQNNITDLSWSIDEAQKSWNSTQINRFLAYEKRIFNIQANSTASQTDIFSGVVNVFEKWTTNEEYLNLVYSINIYIYHATSTEYVWGTVKDFCGCA